MQLAGNRSLNGCPAHFRVPSVGCLRCSRHETGPSTTFYPDPSTIPRILRKQQTVYLRFYFCPRHHGRGMPAKRSRWAGSVAGGPRERSGGPRKAHGRRAGGPRGGRRTPTSRAAATPPPSGRAPRAGSGIAGPSFLGPSRIRAPAAESFSKIVLASPPVFPYSTFSHGGVAQLGERLTGSQEVRGSIPLVSTRALNEAPTQVGAFFHISQMLLRLTATRKIVR